MLTLPQLRAATASLEALDQARAGNPGEPGWWRRFALAAEGLSRTTLATNATVEGYMLRAAVALETLQGVSGAGINRGYEGLLLRIVNALEKGVPGTGSLGKRLVDAAGALTVNNLYYTKLLMGFENGVDGSQVFVDESPVARTGFTIAGGSSASIATAQKKFGNSSGSLPTVDDWIKWPDSDDWHFGMEPFTIDFWARPAAVTGVRQMLGQNNDLNGGAVNAAWAFYEFNGVMQFIFHNSLTNNWTAIAGGAASVVDTWVHTQVDRDLTGKLRLYRNGVMVDSLAYTGSFKQIALELTIGAAADGSGDYLGYLDEIRIMKGRAACGSDAGFAVPVAPYPRA